MPKRLGFHRERIKDHDLSIEINKSTLNRGTTIKYIGVIIDHKLNWCEPAAHVKNRVSKEIGILYKARQFLYKKERKQLYYSYMYPYLIYCIDVCGSACQTHLHPLCLVQNIE